MVRILPAQTIRFDIEAIREGGQKIPYSDIFKDAGSFVEGIVNSVHESGTEISLKTEHYDEFRGGGPAGPSIILLITVISTLANLTTIADFLLKYLKKVKEGNGSIHVKFKGRELSLDYRRNLDESEVLKLLNKILAEDRKKNRRKRGRTLRNLES